MHTPLWDWYKVIQHYWNCKRKWFCSSLILDTNDCPCVSILRKWRKKCCSQSHHCQPSFIRCHHVIFCAYCSNSILTARNQIIVWSVNLLAIITLWFDINFYWASTGDARTQSPTTKNCAPESPTFGEIASFNLAKCNAKVSTWRNHLLDHGILCAR